MLEQIAWNAFETTGSIIAYMFYRELEEEEQEVQQSQEKYDKIEVLSES